MAGKNPSFTFVELFCGVGGFRLGLEAVGGRCVWACEIDRKAAETYRVNFGDQPYHDITKADTSWLPKSYDMLVAGFPCQDFSGLGSQQGLAGSKGQLFYEVVRFLKDTRPPMFLGENVRGLLTMEDGAVMRKVVGELEALGYHVCYGEINSLCVVPQFRARVYIVAFLDEVRAKNFERLPAPPKFEPRRTVASCLQSEEEEPFLSHYMLSVRNWHAVKQSKTSRKYGVAKRVVQPDSFETDTLIHSYRTSKLSLSQFVSGETIAAGHAKRPRWFTPRECARLMGFPELFLLPPGITAYEQLGNAVIPSIIALIAGKMIGEEKKGLYACVNLSVLATGKKFRREFMSFRVSSCLWSGTVSNLVGKCSIAGQPESEERKYSPTHGLNAMTLCFAILSVCLAYCTKMKRKGV